MTRSRWRHLFVMEWKRLMKLRQTPQRPVCMDRRRYHHDGAQLFCPNDQYALHKGLYYPIKMFENISADQLKVWFYYSTVCLNRSTRNHSLVSHSFSTPCYCRAHLTITHPYTPKSGRNCPVERGYRSEVVSKLLVSSARTQSDHDSGHEAITLARHCPMFLQSEAL